MAETQKTTDEATHDQGVQMETSVADLSNTELQAQLGDLATELEQRHQKKELYKQKYTDEREKNAFLQKHYHEELKKKDEIIDSFKHDLSELRKLQSQDSMSLQNVIDHQNVEIAHLRGQDCNQDTMQKERAAGDQTTVMEPPNTCMYPNPYKFEACAVVPPLRYGNPYLKDDDEEHASGLAAGLARPLAPLPAPLMPHVLPSAKVAHVKKMLIVDTESSTDLMPVVEPPVEPPAPLVVELQGAEGGAEATPNAPPAEDEERFQDAPSEPYKECPICRLEFPPHTSEEVIEEHVDQHLEKDKSCPMCGLMFKTDKQDAFEKHVQGHFDTE